MIWVRQAARPGFLESVDGDKRDDKRDGMERWLRQSDRKDRGRGGSPTLVVSQG
jgi:hypothetical protein